MNDGYTLNWSPVQGSPARPSSSHPGHQGSGTNSILSGSMGVDSKVSWEQSLSANMTSQSERKTSNSSRGVEDSFSMGGYDLDEQDNIPAEETPQERNRRIREVERRRRQRTKVVMEQLRELVGGDARRKLDVLECIRDRYKAQKDELAALRERVAQYEEQIQVQQKLLLQATQAQAQAQEQAQLNPPHHNNHNLTSLRPTSMSLGGGSAGGASSSSSSSGQFFPRPPPVRMQVLDNQPLLNHESTIIAGPSTSSPSSTSASSSRPRICSTNPQTFDPVTLVSVTDLNDFVVGPSPQQRYIRSPLGEHSSAPSMHEVGSNPSSSNRNGTKKRKASPGSVCCSSSSSESDSKELVITSVWSNPNLAVYIETLDFRIVAGNHAFKRFIGLGDEQLKTGVSLLSIVPSRRLPSVYHNAHGLLTGATKVVHLDHKETRCSRGHPIHVNLTYTLVKNEEDEPQYFLAYAHIEDGEKCDSDCTTTDSLPCWHNPQHEEPCRGGTSGSKGPSSLP